ncbi:hypothetical protein [Candidatus Villigracilis proximus]
MTLTPIDQNAWINSFDPKKRIITGRAYFSLSGRLTLLWSF